MPPDNEFQDELDKVRSMSIAEYEEYRDRMMVAMAQDGNVTTTAPMADATGMGDKNKVFVSPRQNGKAKATPSTFNPSGHKASHLWQDEITKLDVEEAKKEMEKSWLEEAPPSKNKKPKPKGKVMQDLLRRDPMTEIAAMQETLNLVMDRLDKWITRCEVLEIQVDELRRDNDKLTKQVVDHDDRINWLET